MDALVAGFEFRILVTCACGYQQVQAFES